MAYEVRWVDEAKKDLRKLERDITIRIIKKVELIKENPIVYIKKLVGKEEWSLRIGDYRAIISLDNKNETLSVLKIGHRKNIYDY